MKFREEEFFLVKLLKDYIFLIIFKKNAQKYRLVSSVLFAPK